MEIRINHRLIGSILDIGGGGEGVIGRIYGNNVIAIDNCQEELDEAPDCCTKRLMDACELMFSDQSFDNVTFFYSLMYMTADIQCKSIFEAARVLRSGGTMLIWDCDIRSAYPEPFTVDLCIKFEQKEIHSTYGIVKKETQNCDVILRILKQAEISTIQVKEENGHFCIQCKKD